MANIISERVLSEFMGEKDVIMRFMDDGKIYYITKSKSADEIFLKFGGHRLEIKKNGKNHVLYLYNCSSNLVGMFCMSKVMHGFTPQEIAAQKDVLRFYKIWSNEYKKWIPCVFGNLDQECIVKEWKNISIVYRNGKWHVECGNMCKRYFIIPPGKYDYISEFNEEGLAKVKINKKQKKGQNEEVYEKWGLIDFDGEEIIPVGYKKIENVSNKKCKFIKLLKYEESTNGIDDRLIREYLFDLSLYKYERKVQLFPLDDGFYEDSIQSILSYAKQVLDEEDIIVFESILIKMNVNERKSVLKIWNEDDVISKEDKVQEILKWNQHWLKARFIFETYVYDYAKEYVSDFEKKQFFWNIFFKEETHQEQQNIDFPFEFHGYSEDNLNRLVEWHKRKYSTNWLQDNDIVSSEKESVSFQRIGKDDCVIRKNTYNKETIYEVRKKESPTFYYKNIRSWTELMDSLGDSEPILIHHNKSKNGIEINGYICYFDEKVGRWPIYKIVDNKDSFVVCSFSHDLVNWKDYIIEEKIMMAIRMNPVTYISDERAVTQDCFGQWGVYDLSGNIIVPKGKYAKIDGFKFNLAKVKKVNTIVHWEDMSEDYYDTYGIIDRNGKEIVKCEYDTIYNFYGNDKWYTKMFKNGESIKFHLGYWTKFGNFSDIDYLEEREWKGGNRSFNRVSYDDENSNSDYSVWDALEDEPEAAGNIDYEGW